MYPEEGLEFNLLIAVGVRLRQEGRDLLLRDHLIEPPQLLHQPRQILSGDMAGISLQRHELQHPQNKITQVNKTGEPNAKQTAVSGAEEEGGTKKQPADSDVTLALSDRSSTCVNCPCSEGSDTTTPTNPDISAGHGPIPPAPEAAARANPDQSGRAAWM